MTAATIYKLLTRAEWEAARTEGVYRGSAHDLRDGFIHFSTAAQLLETARKYFAGVPDLLLLAVDVGALKEPHSPHPVPLPMGEGTLEYSLRVFQGSLLPSASACGCGHSSSKLAKASLLGEGQGEGSGLRWESARGSDLFPHLYADLPLDAVRSATAIPLDAGGIPIIPGGLEP